MLSNFLHGQCRNSTQILPKQPLARSKTRWVHLVSLAVTNMTLFLWQTDKHALPQKAIVKLRYPKGDRSVYSGMITIWRCVMFHCSYIQERNWSIFPLISDVPYVSRWFKVGIHSSLLCIQRGYIVSCGVRMSTQLKYIMQETLEINRWRYIIISNIALTSAVDLFLDVCQYWSWHSTKTMRYKKRL